MAAWQNSVSTIHCEEDKGGQKLLGLSKGSIEEALESSWGKTPKDPEEKFPRVGTSKQFKLHFWRLGFCLQSCRMRGSVANLCVCTCYLWNRLDRAEVTPLLHDQDVDLLLQYSPLDWR